MGLVPRSAAITGSDVAMTVESIISMKNANAMMSGMVFIGILGARGRGKEGKTGTAYPQ